VQWPAEDVVKDASKWLKNKLAQSKQDTHAQKLLGALTSAVDATGNFTVVGVAAFVTAVGELTDSFVASDAVSEKLVAYAKFIKDELTTRRPEGVDRVDEETGLRALRSLTKFLEGADGNEFATFIAARMAATKLENAVAQYDAAKSTPDETLAQDPEFILLKSMMGELVSLNQVFEKRELEADCISEVFTVLMATTGTKIDCIKAASIESVKHALDEQVVWHRDVCTYLLHFIRRAWALSSFLVGAIVDRRRNNYF